MTTGNTAPTGTTPETGKGTYFTLRNVTLTPAVPAVAQTITITGDVYLFGIPFLALAWITADITIPKVDLDVTNPVIHVESIAFGGKFSLTVKNGISRQGSCSALVQAYGGPTYKENLAVVGGIVTLPPFSPVVAAVPAIVFTVSGTLTQNFTVGVPAVQGEYLEGSQVTLASAITNTTAVDTPVTIHLQVYNQGDILGIKYNGNLVTDATIGPITIPAGQIYYASWTYTEGSTAGSRDIIITVQDANKAVVGQGTFDGLYSVTAPVPTSLTISPSTIPVGGTVQFNLAGFGSAELVNFTIAGTEVSSTTTNYDGADIGSFLYLGTAGTFVLVATGVTSGKSAQATLTVTASTTTRKIVINPDAIPYGADVNFTISGFPANDGFKFWIVSSADETPEGNGYEVGTDNNGNGSGSMACDEPTAGTYYLVDGEGDVAQFTTTSGSPVFTLSVDSSNTVQGGTITFSLYSFNPNTVVKVSTPNGNSVSVTTDDVGDYVGTMTNTEPPGAYSLTATDAAGQTATAPFTVLPPATVSFKVQLVDPARIYMLGTQLVSSVTPGSYSNGPLGGEFPAGAVPITSWTCEYYDPVTLALVNIGSLSPNSPASIQNVNPGGYIVTTFTSSSGTTAPIQSTVFTASNGDVWDFDPYNALAGIIGDIYLSTSGPVVNPELTVSPTSIVQNPSGSPLGYIATGFLPDESVGISVVGGGGITVTTNEIGGVEGTFMDSDPVGSYTLQAVDSAGNKATAAFNIVAGSSTTPTLVITQTQIDPDSLLSFSISGFPPNESVGVSVVGGGGITLTTNSSGDASGSFIDGEGFGLYTLQAVDAAGNKAEASFTIL